MIKALKENSTLAFRERAFKALAVSVVFQLAMPALAAPGDLDPKFSGDGKLTTKFYGWDIAWGVALQEDKIVAVGSGGGRFAVARYKRNGRLDPAFAGDGTLTTDLASDWESAHAVAIQGDRRIIAAGVSGGKNERFAIVRYKPNGELDPSFSGDGIVTTNFTSGFDAAHGVAIQANNRIVVAGETGGKNPRFALARYKRNGTIDPSFSDNGKLTTNFTSDLDKANGLAIQSDGKIVVAGVAVGNNEQFALARYNTDGTLDQSFGNDGTLMTNFTRGWDRASAVAIQKDGKILAVGWAGNGFALARYEEDGNLDESFEGDGKVITEFDYDVDAAQAFAVDIQDDGKIVAAGQTLWADGDYSDLAIARYNQDGTLDTSFGEDGKRTVGFDVYWAAATSVAIQEDGKIVAAGYAQEDDAFFALTRFLGG